jgi:hypothetical protein
VHETTVSPPQHPQSSQSTFALPYRPFELSISLVLAGRDIVKQALSANLDQQKPTCLTKDPAQDQHTVMVHDLNQGFELLLEEPYLSEIRHQAESHCRDRTIWWLVFLKRSWRVGVSLSSLDSKDLFLLCFALVSLSLLKRYLCIRISSLNR